MLNNIFFQALCKLVKALTTNTPRHTRTMLPSQLTGSKLTSPATQPRSLQSIQRNFMRAACGWRRRQLLGSREKRGRTPRRAADGDNLRFDWASSWGPCFSGSHIRLCENAIFTGCFAHLDLDMLRLELRDFHVTEGVVFPNSVIMNFLSFPFVLFSLRMTPCIAFHNQITPYN